MTEAALEDAYSQYLHRQGARDAAARRRARLQTKRKPGDPNGPGEAEVDSEPESGSDAEAPASFDEPDASDSEVLHSLCLPFTMPLSPCLQSAGVHDSSRLVS